MTAFPSVADAQFAAGESEGLTAGARCLSVSVVIPVKNDADRLKVCLRSLRSQQFPDGDYEIIVVDNGSSDDSAEVAARHGATVLCCPALPVGALRNRGVERARGELLAFVDSDHELPPNWIAAGVNALHQSPSIRVVGAPCSAPPRGTWVQRGWELHRLRQRERRAVPWLGAGNMFVRRADFVAAGGFDEQLVAAEDVDLCVRLGERPGDIVADPAIANIHHGEPRTLAAFFWKEYWRGSSGLRGFFGHGMPLHELPSLAYPLYQLLAALLLAFAAVAAGLLARPLWLLPAAIVVVLPALVLAAKTCWQVRQPAAFLPLAVLYQIYGWSRAAALFKR